MSTTADAETGSVLYVELPDLVSAKREWMTTSIGRMLADPEIHAAIGELMGQEPLNPWALLEGQIRKNAPGGGYDMAMGMLGSLRAFSRPNTSFTASVSTRSFTLVDVPCALM